MKEKYLVCVLIVNYNTEKLISRCLNSISKNTRFKQYNILVVDNGSSDNSIKAIKKFKGVFLIKNKKNYGYGKAANIGIKFAIKKYSPKYFFLLNSDTEVKKNWLESSVKLAEKNEKVGIIGSATFGGDGIKQIGQGWVTPFGVRYYYGNEIKKVGWVCGAASLVRAEVFKKIGVFDEIYSPAYYEDSDLCERARKEGFILLSNPQSQVIHLGQQTTNKFNKDHFFYFFYRNRIYFFIKRKSIFYLLPRIPWDIIKAISKKRFKLLIKSYLEGIKLLHSKTIR